jgi:hypothetical protein
MIILGDIMKTKSIIFVLIVFTVNLATYLSVYSKSNSMNILVPAYFNPQNSNYWDRLTQESKKMPGKICAIANVDNGPGTIKSEYYNDAINNFRNTGGLVIGYVDSNYTKNSQKLVMAQIDSWYTKYNIDGIFIDCQQNVSGYEQYYLNIYNYVKKNYNNGMVVANPGTNTLESYINFNKSRTADIFCVFENNNSFGIWTLPDWASSYSSENFAAIPYDIFSPKWKETLDRASLINMGWVYCTDEPGNNKWGSLPTYFEDMCFYIREYYTQYNNKIVIRVGDTFMNINSGTKENLHDNPNLYPVIVNNRVMIPAKKFVEKLGATINWDNYTKKVLLIKNKTNIEIDLSKGENITKELYYRKNQYINSSISQFTSNIKINGNEYKSDYPTVIIKDRLYIPLRFVSENLQSHVSWDSSNYSVTIKFNK